MAEFSTAAVAIEVPDVATLVVVPVTVVVALFVVVVVVVYS